MPARVCDRSLGDCPEPAYQGAILLAHLHWDHMEGLPFFAAGDHYQSSVVMYLPQQRGSPDAISLPGHVSAVLPHHAGGATWLLGIQRPRTRSQ